MTKVRQQSPVLNQILPHARVQYVAHDFRKPLHVSDKPANMNIDLKWDYRDRKNVMLHELASFIVWSLIMCVAGGVWFFAAVMYGRWING